MAQDKISNQHCILLIGSGRLANHLQYWYQFNKSTSVLMTWDRHQDPLALSRLCQKATHIWLAISDRSIIPFYEKNLQGFDSKIVHFSGSLHDERLISAHPLMTFSTELYTDIFYSKINFAITGCANLKEALPDFENSFFHLSANQKPFYHALCVMTANFPQMLWNEIYKLASQHNIPTDGFDTYIQKTADNYLKLKEKSITGPFIRNDTETITKNKLALADQGLQNIYKAFEKEFLK